VAAPLVGFIPLAALAAVLALVCWDMVEKPAIAGGFCVTGTIARTATNVRAGARSPIAGMLHAVFLLAFLMVAAPLVGFIPLAALAAVLALVCWDMVEKPAIA
ncbi:hypothetical protein CNY89_26665, partial [Amaricoccus sp. HAR-UPW-R2A-40]